MMNILSGATPLILDVRQTGSSPHLGHKVFEFAAPIKMKGNALWVDVTRLMKYGMGETVARINAAPELAPQLGTYVDHLSRLEHVKEIDFHVEKIVGADKTVDVVVEIFNRVNSRGTKLSKADLALARFAQNGRRPGRGSAAPCQAGTSQASTFRLDWLLRVVNAVVT